MAAPTAAGLTVFTPAEGRRFAFTLAPAFALLALVLWWRGHGTAAAAFGTIAALLALAGLLVPARLGGVSRAWMAFGLLLSRIVSPVVLALMYFAVFTPAGLLRRTVGRSPLARDPRAPTYWVPRPRRDAAKVRESLQRQF